MPTHALILQARFIKLPKGATKKKMLNNKYNNYVTIKEKSTTQTYIYCV